MTGPKKVLFVCVENAGRSQMAEAFFRKYAPSQFQAISAGTKPSEKVNPIVVQVMREVGIEIQNNQPKLLTNQVIDDATSTVNMGCIDKEACPALFVKEILDWNISDPKGKEIDQVRKIRDEIEVKVKEFVKNLKV
jgi:arsenate reductase (thioredoxin)